MVCGYRLASQPRQPSGSVDENVSWATSGDETGIGKSYVDASETRAVTGGHVLVHGLDGITAGHVAVLLVHVVGAGAGVVADPDTEVLDLHGSLLLDLVYTVSPTVHLSIPLARGFVSTIPCSS